MAEEVVIEMDAGGGPRIGEGYPLAVIAGPCVIEDEDMCLEVAGELGAICSGLGMPYIFKASFDKANRTSVDSYRGPGLEEGLEVLERVRRRAGVPVTSDVHETRQVEPAARVLDLIQIPAFLSRQTDLLVAAGRTGRPVNIKKGQFMAPGDMQHAAEKVASTGNRQILLTERGTSFGYHNLVVDLPSLAVMRSSGWPVAFDATHSVQRPGGRGGSSGGEREFVPLLARAAVAAGIDALFLEVHPDPDRARCDGPNMVPLDRVGGLLRRAAELDRVIRKG